MNWNKQTYWKDPGEGHKKGKVAQQTSEINCHTLLLRIVVHDNMNMRHIFIIFRTIANKWPNWFPVIEVTLSSPPPKNLEQNILEYVDHKKGTFFKS